MNIFYGGFVQRFCIADFLGGFCMAVFGGGYW